MKTKTVMRNTVAEKEMIEIKSWEEFRGTGLLWFINMILQMFGWSIVVEVNSEQEHKVFDAYPVRTKFRGFEEQSISNGYKQVSKWMKDNGRKLYKESKD